MGEFHQFLKELSTRDISAFLFKDKNLSYSHWIFTKLDMCIDIEMVWFWTANRQIS